MSGTVIITGSNGSLALGFVEYLLSIYPSITLLAAVRNSSPESDMNTAKLAQIIKTKNAPDAHIETLDLASLASVRSFADQVGKRIACGELPLITAIICNAMAWSLNEQIFTPDGFERTFQVGHLSHFLLVLKLLEYMAPDGRVVLLGSVAHYPENSNPLSKLLAEFPEDINRLVKPESDEAGQEHDRGFQRYSTTKLANVMLMHDLNSRFKKDPKLSRITVTAMDPGGLVDSRANSIQKPTVRAIFSLLNMLIPVLKYITSHVRRSEDAGRDLVELSVGERFKDVRGYHVGLKAVEPAKSSMDIAKQQILWKACWEWAGLEREETALSNAVH